MLVQNSGPHVVEYLQKRVESLTAALERAQDRINELEKVFGTDDDLVPLMELGLSPSESRVVHLLRTRDSVTYRQVMFAVYADVPDRMNEVNASISTKTFMSTARTKLKRLGITIEDGRKPGYPGLRMTGPDKARLAKLIASGARLVTRGRPDRKYYKKATRGVESRAMNG